jgi:pimeloyl-ACP methyl ester carboxylesterase
MSTPFSDFMDVAIVIVQGSFHTPLAYQRLTEGLQLQGLETFQPELPSCSDVEDAEFPSKTLDDDSAIIKSLIERLVVDEGRRVFIVMHSYGGLVGSNAISENLSFKNRRTAGLSGGVFHLFYIAAFLLDEGQSVLGTFGESPNNDVRVHKHASFMERNITDNQTGRWSLLHKARGIFAL